MTLAHQLPTGTVPTESDATASLLLDVVPPTHTRRVIERSPVPATHGTKRLIDVGLAIPLWLLGAPVLAPRIVVKRVVDLLLAVLLLVAVSPVLVFIVLAIRCESRGQIIYRQIRIGRRGTPFRCWKFRTMVTEADQRLEELLEADPASRQEFEETRKLTADPRITRVGALLRRSSLDELPQLWNVIRGEMSLVGPRPVVPDELPWYGHAADTVLRVRPGITGAWQTSGRSDLSYPRRVAIDLDYALHHTGIGDLRILLATVRTVASRRGAY